MRSLKQGNINTGNFEFFIKNIQNGLQKISSIEGNASGGGNRSDGKNSVTNEDISAVQNLFTKLQNILNKGSTQGASEILQNLVSVLNGLTAKVADKNALKLLGSIIENIKNLQAQASSSKIDMNNFANLLIQSVNKLNEFIDVLNSDQGSSDNNSSGDSDDGVSVNVKMQ